MIFEQWTPCINFQPVKDQGQRDKEDGLGAGSDGGLDQVGSEAYA